MNKLTINLMNECTRTVYHRITIELLKFFFFFGIPYGMSFKVFKEFHLNWAKVTYISKKKKSKQIFTETTLSCKYRTISSIYFNCMYFHFLFDF